MEVNSQFGKQQIDPDTLITLPSGMLGFTALTRYKLFHEAGKPTVFWLQSVDDQEVRFPVIDPDHLNVAYELSLSDEELALLQLDDLADAAILVTLARGAEPDAPLHANFMAPIIINTNRRIGLQKSLNEVDSKVVISAA
jgi:flagellar assembly factor FliW